MINVSYDRDTNSTLVKLNNLTLIKDHLPLTIKFKNIISGEIHYEAELIDNSWVEWKGAEQITNILVYSSTGKILHTYKWDVTINGDIHEKMLWYYLKGRQLQGLNSNGLVIGAHDGRNGHWIYPVKENLTDATLVDGSEKQFQNLKENYFDSLNTEFKNTIVTTDGSDVKWYQGGEGYTDTVIPSVINGWLDSSQITKTYRKSISINDLMKNKNYDWLHLDVEGLDGDLILALESKPNLIIYEDENLNDSIKSRLKNWFSKNNYTIVKHSCNILAIKNG